MALALSTTLLNNGSLRRQNPFSHRPDLSASFYPSCSRSGSPMKPLLALRSHAKPLVASTEGSKERSKTNLATQAKLHPRRWLFSLRLRPRLRLLSSRLRMFSFRGFEEEARNVFRRNRKRITLSAVVLAVLGFCFLFLKLTAEPAVKVMPYSELVTRIQNGHVSAVQFEEGSRRIFYSTRFDPQNDDSLANDEGENTLGSLKNGKNAGVKWEYSTRRIDHDENFLLGLMREKGTMYSSAPQSVVSTLRGMLILVIPLWISLTPTMWFLYRYLSAANSPAKKRKPSNQKVRFDDVEGVDAAKEELMEIVSCLRGSINYKKLGAKLPRGVLLVGRPGTGKTLLARSVAGEAGVPFFSVSASEFVELFVGRGAARIRDLFKVAKKCSPSIVFIDELDAVGGRRGRSFNDERDQTLNQLLTEMDGFESDVRVIVIAATNRPEALDPALCRPGRFSRKVLVGEPDLEGRKRILAVHLRGIPLEEEPQIISDLVACLTPGYVGADLANIVNEAALLAARRGGERVTRRDIMDALERAKFGINDKRLASAATKCLGKLLPWMQRRDGKSDDLHALLGYQTLN